MAPETYSEGQSAIGTKWRSRMPILNISRPDALRSHVWRYDGSKVDAADMFDHIERIREIEALLIERRILNSAYAQIFPGVRRKGFKGQTRRIDPPGVKSHIAKGQNVASHAATDA
ncbi:MAG TPA: hypothetical protein DHK64_10535 [Rhodobiaceae bacterium]|nr:hypothetical protein [Rhodobiaceae bacterium]